MGAILLFGLLQDLIIGKLHSADLGMNKWTCFDFSSYFLFSNEKQILADLKDENWKYRFLYHCWTTLTNRFKLTLKMYLKIKKHKKYREEMNLKMDHLLHKNYDCSFFFFFFIYLGITFAQYFFWLLSSDCVLLICSGESFIFNFFKIKKVNMDLRWKE